MYIPGTADYKQYTGTKGEMFVLNTSQRTLAQKRLLNPDEYAYYYGFLDREDVDDPVKAAIAVVLDADLKNMYQKHYPDFKDEKILEWVQVFKELSGQDRIRALAEINAFDNMLFQPDSPGWYNEKLAANRNVFVLDILRAKSEAEKEREVEKLIKAEQEEALKKEGTTLDERQKLIDKTINDHISKNFRLYVAAILGNHPMYGKMNQSQASSEYELRMRLVAALEANEKPAKELLGIYTTGLDLINAEVTGYSLSNKIERLIRGSQHPIARLFK